MKHINLVKESRFVNVFGNEVVLSPLVAAEMIEKIEKTEKEYIPKLMRGETLEGVYQCYNRKDGGTVPLELNSVGYFGGKEPKTENFEYTICIFANITERKRAEEEVEKSRKFLATIIDNIPDIVTIMDPQHRFALVNQAYCDITGHTKGEVIGKTAYWEKDKAVFQTGKGMDISERSYTDLEGKRHYVSVKKAPLTDESGEVSHVVTISRDITERKKADEVRERLLKELETLDKMKRDFLNVAYHEMRTPLAPIVGYASLLEQGELTEKQKKYVRIIEKSARQLEEMINRMLEASRIEAGKAELALQDVSISEIVNNVLERAKPQVNAKRQTISFVVPEGIEVEGDKQGITAIFDNLISNAIKYTGEKGRIDIVAEDRQEEKDIRVCVADTGAWISEENLPRVFERFYMVDTSLTRKGGLGLGLTIVKGYVELHEGEVWATSEPEKGSKFWFTLPKKQNVNLHPAS
jgi:PAS domain S-box-containing protein